MRVIRNLTAHKPKDLQGFSPFTARLKPRTRSDVTIWSLPEELQLLLLRELHIKDLLSMRTVHSQFCELIDNNSILWTNVSFCDAWPNSTNIIHFEKASKEGNVEALLKLGVAYLYSEGLPGSVGGQLMTINGDQAAAMFCQAESLTPGVSPFTWLFIRPPWSLSGACCKEYVFNKMRQLCLDEGNHSVLPCIAQILLLLGEEQQLEAITYLERVSSCKSTDAAFLLWEQRHKTMVLDRAGQLESIRRLRDIASLGHTEARLSLCRAYAAGQLGGISLDQASSVVRELIQFSSSLPLSKVFQRNTELTHSMRYILVDWLVEVAGMKDFTSLTLHTAINVVDRYMISHTVPRTKLQLLGVAAMVLCSRLINKEIITIREAAWLTDNTYKYEDVVRMMGEIISTLKGRIRVPTILDYVELLCDISGCDQRTRCLAEYICEMALLELTMFDVHSLSQIAASCVLLARVSLKHEPWSLRMQTFSGFALHDFMECCVLIHERCFVVGAMVDHREVKLQAVKSRYSDDKFHNVGEIPGIERHVLTELFGVQVCCHNTSRSWGRMNPKHLIMSPSRHMKQQERNEQAADREQAGTPTLECSDVLNDSAMSGYDGDREDADESLMEFEDEDPDLHSLWCADPQEKVMFNLSAEDSGIRTGSCSTKSSTHKSPSQSFVSLRVKRRSHNDVFLSDESSQGNNLHNNSSMHVFHDQANQGSARTRATRSSSRDSLRPVLRSVNVPSTFMRGKLSAKRKSTQEMGNENKMHVASS